MPWKPKTHRPPRPALPAHQEQARSARPYRRLLWTKRYRRFVHWLLAERPLCEDCQAAGRVTASTQVHHVRKLSEHPEDLVDPEQCMSLCQSCHSVRTKRGE
jgi:5-methylcytosine-specific restriction endonuclease McrA